MKCCNNKKAIDNLYKNIAVKDRLRESEDSREIEKKIALSLGYTLEDLDNEANLGLGCGNPIENANLKSGEIVLDLGCGKGMDVFKACKIVGKEGLVIGVDRLSEMVERANYIRGKKGFLNTDFREWIDYDHPEELIANREERKLALAKYFRTVADEIEKGNYDE